MKGELFRYNNKTAQRDVSAVHFMNSANGATATATTGGGGVVAGEVGGRQHPRWANGTVAGGNITNSGYHGVGSSINGGSGAGLELSGSSYLAGQHQYPPRIRNHNSVQKQYYGNIKHSI